MDHIDALKKICGSTLAAVVTEALTQIHDKGIAQGAQEVHGKARLYLPGEEAGATWIGAPAKIRRGEEFRAEKMRQKSRAGWVPVRKFALRPNSKTAQPRPKVFAKGRLTLRGLKKDDPAFAKMDLTTNPRGELKVHSGDLQIEIARKGSKQIATIGYSGQIGKTIRLFAALKGSKKRDIVAKALRKAKRNYLNYGIAIANHELKKAST